MADCFCGKTTRVESSRSERRAKDAKHEKTFKQKDLECLLDWVSLTKDMYGMEAVKVSKYDMTKAYKLMGLIPKPQLDLVLPYAVRRFGCPENEAIIRSFIYALLVRIGRPYER